MIFSDMDTQGLLRYQVLKHALARLRRIKHRRIKLLAKHLTETLHLTILRRIPLELGNRLTSYFGNRWLAITHAGVTL